MKNNKLTLPSEEEARKWLNNVTFPLIECDIRIVTVAFLLLLKESKIKSNYRRYIKHTTNSLVQNGDSVLNYKVWHKYSGHFFKKIHIGLKLLCIFCIIGKVDEINEFPTFIKGIKNTPSPFFLISPLFKQLQQILEQFDYLCIERYNRVKLLILKLSNFAEEKGYISISLDLFLNFKKESNDLSLENQTKVNALIKATDALFNFKWEDPQTGFPYNPLPLPSIKEADTYFKSLPINTPLRLDMLITKACASLKNFGESNSSIGQYLKMFRRFWWKCFKLGENSYRPELYDNYLKFEKELTATGQQRKWKESIAVRAGMVLATTATLGFIPYNIFLKKKIKLYELELEQIRSQLSEYCIKEKNLSRSFTYLYDFILREIFDACSIKNVNQLKEIDNCKLDLILLRLKNKCKVSSLSTLLPLLQQIINWLYAKELLQTNLSKNILFPHYIKTYNPPYLTVENQVKLENYIYTESWRNRAIVLLALQLGLRESDIIRLRKDNIDFRHKKLSIIQQKTKVSLELPLTDKIIEAIQHYLKEERPICYKKGEALFVSTLPPFKTIKSIYSIVKKAIEKANITIENGSACGSHLLRYSLAHTMLRTQTDHKIITDTLGHISEDSDRPYLSMNDEMLLKCALDLTLIGQGPLTEIKKEAQNENNQ